MRIRLMFGDEAGQAVRFDGIRLKVPGLVGKYDFTGKREDEDTGGLMYFGARWYDTESCRFVTMDPVKNGGNWYLYCRDNPINRVDPTGEVDSSVNLGQYAYSWSQTHSNAYSNAGNIGQATAQHGESLTANTAPGACSYSATANIGQATATIGEGFVSYTTCSVNGNTASVTTSFASDEGRSITTTNYNASPNGTYSRGITLTICSFNFSNVNGPALVRGIGMMYFGVVAMLEGLKFMGVSSLSLVGGVVPVSASSALVGAGLAFTGEFMFFAGVVQSFGALKGRDFVGEFSSKVVKGVDIVIDNLPYRF